MPEEQLTIPGLPPPGRVGKEQNKQAPAKPPRRASERYRETSREKKLRLEDRIASLEVRVLSLEMELTLLKKAMER